MPSPPSPFYRAIAQEIQQGDIFVGVPHVHLQSPLRVVREAASKAGHQIWGVYPWPPPAGEAPALPKLGVKGGGFNLEPPGREDVAASCQVCTAIALNHDCDLENEPKHRLVAMIHPLETVQPEHRDVIRQNRNYGRFYLPAHLDFITESYIDLRRLTSMVPAFLDPTKRKVSLSEESMQALFRQLFLFLTHRELKTDPGQT